jgi:hypothetical protein
MKRVFSIAKKNTLRLYVLYLEDKIKSVVANIGGGLVVVLPVLGGPVFGGQGTLPVNVQEMVALKDEEGDGDEKRPKQYLR